MWGRPHRTDRHSKGNGEERGGVVRRRLVSSRSAKVGGSVKVLFCFVSVFVSFFLSFFFRFWLG